MARRGENIYKRKDNRWEGRYIKGYDYKGKAQFGYVYAKTYREVREKLTAAKQTSFNKPTPNRKDFSYFCDEWLILSHNRVKESTYVKYHNTVNRHLKPDLGCYLPQNLNTILIEEFSNALLMDGLSPKTVRDIRTEEALHTLGKVVQLVQIDEAVFQMVEFFGEDNVRNEQFGRVIISGVYLHERRMQCGFGAWEVDIDQVVVILYGYFDHWLESYAPPDTTKKNRNTQLVSIKLESITATSHGAYGNDSIIQIFRSLKRAPYHCPQVMLDCNYLWHGIGHDQESLGIPPIRAFEIPTKPNQYCSTNGMHRVVLTLMIFYCKPKLLPPWFDGGIYAVID